MSSNLEIVKGIDDALVSEVEIKVNTQEESIKVLESVFLKKGMRSIQWEGELDDVIEKDFDIKKWTKISLLPRVLKEPQKFSSDDIPPFAREYCLLVAKSSQAPIEYLLMTLITMLSSLIGKMIKVQPKKNDDTWIVVVNLWGLLIGDPSSLKTPMMNYILSFLDPYIKSRYDEFIEQNEAFKVKAKSINAKIKAVEERVKQAYKKPEKDFSLISSLERDLAKLELELKISEPIEDRLMVNDITIESFLNILSQVKKCLLFFKDEYAGLLSGFSKKGRETERTTLLEAFNGNLSIRVDRLSRDDDYVEKAAVSMLGSIQPGVLNKYILRSQRSGDGDDGFIERHQLMVYPELSEEFEYIDVKIPLEKSSRIRNVVDKLIGLPGIIKDSLVLKFSDESQKLFIEWYENLFKKVRKKREITTKHLSHLGKYNSFMPSLALIFHICDCIDRDIEILDSKISIESTKLAIRWCEILEEHAIKIYGESDCRELVSAHTFLEKILNGELRQGYPVRQIYRRGMANLSTHSDVKNALKILEQHNIAREEKIYGTRGAPSYILDINPEVYDVF